MTATIIPTVRIHSHITRYKWARLWYLARALDPYGSGHVEIPTASIWWICGKARSTMYEWLREGRAAGAFRSYKIARDSVNLYIGSLANVCKVLGLVTWGTVTTVPIHEVSTLTDLRKIGVQAYCQEKQRQSYYAAINALSEQERSFYKVADPRALAIKSDSQSSAKPERGEMAGLIGLGPKRVFTSAGFVPVGVSQAGVASDLGWSIRSIQRRLSGIDRRQIVQHRAAYKMLRMAMDYESQEYSDGILRAYRVGEGEYRLFESNGLSTHSKAPTGIGITSGRFFSYAGKTWLYRCNVYDLDFPISSMAYRRKSYKCHLLNISSGVTKKEDKKSLCSNEKGGASPFGEELQEEMQRDCLELAGKAKAMTWQQEDLKVFQEGPNLPPSHREK